MNEIRYPYKPNLFLTFVFVVLIGGAITYRSGSIALSNEKLIIFDTKIEKSNLWFSAFNWVVVVSSGLIPAIGILSIYVTLTTNREVVLTDTHIQIPTGRIKINNVSIAFKDISKVSLRPIQNLIFLQIDHTDGANSIEQSMLPSKKDFENIIVFVCKKMAEAQQDAEV